MHAEDQAGVLEGGPDEQLNPTITLTEAQVVLAEKRTVLAVMRTGLAIFALPLSVLSVLIATSKYYSIDEVLHFLVPLLAISGALIVLACYLVVQSLVRFIRLERTLRDLKRQSPLLRRLIQ